MCKVQNGSISQESFESSFRLNSDPKDFTNEESCPLVAHALNPSPQQISGFDARLV